MVLSQRALQTNGKWFSNFEFFAENRKNFKRIERREYLSNCNVLYINGFVSQRALKKLMENFFPISESFFELVTIY